MAHVLADRVQETSTTTGTGTLTLAGALLGFLTFSSAIGNANTTYYGIVNPGTAEWEVGFGTVGAGTLARTTVMASSNAGAAVNFSAGTKNVYCGMPASAITTSGGANKFPMFDGSGNFTASGKLQAQGGIAAATSGTSQYGCSTADGAQIIGNGTNASVTLYDAAGNVRLITKSTGVDVTGALNAAGNIATVGSGTVMLSKYYVRSGNATVGQGGQYQVVSDDGLQRWWMGVSGAGGAKDFAINDVANSITPFLINNSTGLITLGYGAAVTGALNVSGNINTAAAGNVITSHYYVRSGNATVGQGGQYQIVSDDGVSRWSVGVSGAGGAKDFLINDIVNSRNVMSINSSSGLVTLSNDFRASGVINVQGAVSAGVSGTAQHGCTAADGAQIIGNGTNASVTLYDAGGNVRLITKSAGVDITGTATVNGSAILGGTSGAESLRAIAIGSAVNRIEVSGSTTGNNPTIAAAGSDTNLDLIFTPKGTGVIRFGTHTGISDQAISGYITIKDSGGTTRKLAVIT